jgi:hypothetical protein
VDPLDIPTEITKLTYSLLDPPVLSQNDAARMLAHFWPAIEAHTREQVAQEIVTGLAEMHDASTTAEHYRPGLRGALRNIHRLARA